MTSSDGGPTSAHGIAADLRARIESGEFPTGGQLPARRVLTEHYGAAGATVDRALHQLGDEGWITGRPRAGWLVRPQRPVIRATRNRLSRAERAAGRGAFLTDLHAAGLSPYLPPVEVRIETAPEHIAAALGVPADEPVCVRDRVMGTDGGEVLQLATSYLPRDITRGTAIEAADTGPGGLYARLEDAGHTLTRYTERVAIGRASEDEAAQMGVNPGEPVFRVTRTAWAGERPVEVNVITITGVRYELLYELPAE